MERPIIQTIYQYSEADQVRRDRLLLAIHELQKEYEARVKPYVDELVAIDARTPRNIVVFPQPPLAIPQPLVEGTDDA